MSVLFGSILAQVVSLGLADRTEARYIATQDSYAEASTSPRVSLNLDWKHTRLSNTFISTGYSPTFIATPLLDQQSPHLLVFHTANAGITHTERRRRTTITISEQAGYTLTKLQVLARSGGQVRPTTFNQPGAALPGAPTTTPPPGTPTTGTTTPVLNNNIPVTAGDPTVHLFTESTSIGVQQLVSPLLTVGGEIAYLMSGSVREDQRDLYPLVRGPRAQVFGTDRISRTDRLTSSLSSQYATTSTTGNDVWINVANESWSHTFDAHTSSVLGGGLSASRTSQPNGLVFWQIFPVFNASISSGGRLARGHYVFGLNANVSPILDVIRVAVDPRLSTGAFAGWNKDRFSTSLTVSTALAIGQENKAAGFNSITSQLVASYALAQMWSIDGGVRGVWQSFNGATTVPGSLVSFVGLTFGASVPLSH